MLSQFQRVSSLHHEESPTYAERNSASEAAKHKLHTPAVTRPQMTEVDPPLGKARDRLAESAVQEFKIANASPSIDNMEKLRCSSCLWPRPANAAASASMLALRLAIWLALRLSRCSVQLALRSVQLGLRSVRLGLRSALWSSAPIVYEFTVGLVVSKEDREEEEDEEASICVRGEHHPCCAWHL